MADETKYSYKIGEVANLFGLTNDAIRYYESRGIITPKRDEESGYRYFDSWDINFLLINNSMTFGLPCGMPLRQPFYFESDFSQLSIGYVCLRTYPCETKNHPLCG